MEVPTIHPRDLAALRDRGDAIELIDVRTPPEFREVHCSFARNVPLTDLNAGQWAADRKGDQGRPLYVICKSGSRGRSACEKLISAGVTEVFNVDGGTAAWVECGLPVNRGKKAISLERQVRIAAGSLVLVGALLGILVHPYLIGISAFVGAGLVFAGLTDTCGMGMLLARMPWNRTRAADCGVSA